MLMGSPSPRTRAYLGFDTRQIVMKLRHAAALALVGWYLMAPSLGRDGMPLTGSPLGDWSIVESFDTAESCKQSLAKTGAQFNFPKGPFNMKDLPEGQRMFFFAQCISTDDPRLK